MRNWLRKNISNRIVFGWRKRPIKWAANKIWSAMKWSADSPIGKFITGHAIQTCVVVAVVAVPILLSFIFKQGQTNDKFIDVGWWPLAIIPIGVVIWLLYKKKFGTTVTILLVATVLWVGQAFIVPALGYRYATPEWSEWEKTIPGQATFESDPGQDLDLEMVEADSNRPPVSFVHKNGAIHQLSREGIVGKVKTFRWRAIGNNSFWFKISYGPKRM